ncbi:hypothetical protein MasN3_48030 [Massilia varians]|uniref:diguanylate cyclase n=1 Tax=Massilia varians TaxID=457921 RepID=A0ABN6TMT3_9BURK|nr:diguanylate cyclase [Massilia varians]BDT61309.1 hypothetical protein MasN3_48030 [Massilia varians]
MSKTNYRRGYKLADQVTSDIVCRLGGEELVLLLPECTAEAAAKCAESIRQTLNEIAIAHLNQNLSGISASFGVASYPLHAIHGEELLKAADRALYVAKNNGRNRVVTAEPCDSLQFATAQIPIVASCQDPAGYTRAS